VSRVLYFDCFSGISGDMAIGALLDAGLPFDGLRAALGSLTLGDVHVHASKVLRAGVSATRFTVHAHDQVDHEGKSTDHEGQRAEGKGHRHHHEHANHERKRADHEGQRAEGRRHRHDHNHHGHRSLPEIFALIDQSGLSVAGRDRAKAMFQRLAEAEAAIHAMPVEQVHLHEVGALDSIIDIVGIVHALEWVDADRIVCSALNVGGGMVQSAHGTFPVPAPATVKSLGEAPVYSGPVQKEMVTPTGALIARTYANSFGPIPLMKIERVGYGAGERDNEATPNVLRVLIGDESAHSGVSEGERTELKGQRVTVIECEIDDMNPQIFGVAMERLYAAGALEVFYVPVQMKKNRPGTLLTVIAMPERRDQLAEVIFRETTTIGLRHYDVERECLAREIVTVDTPVGAIRFKVARRNGTIVNATPEFDDCAKVAAANNLSVKDVQRIAIKAYSL
jgi:pyridinium-3,5-bisthiocarboxylic acid mononucleotide nickel chelatase